MFPAGGVKTNRRQKNRRECVVAGKASRIAQYRCPGGGEAIKAGPGKRPAAQDMQVDGGLSGLGLMGTAC